MMRAPMETSASRWVAMVRRAGKSPPGGASDARPRRASSGPSSSTEPRRRPTSAASGSSLTTSGQRMRRVVVPIPSTDAPSSTSRRAITSTSLMRGTLWSTHSSVVSRQADRSGSAAFLLPSTETAPDRRRPPSMSSVDIMRIAECAKRGRPNGANIRQGRRFPRAARRRNGRRTSLRHRSMSARISAAVAPPSLTMKLACAGETRAPPTDAPLRPARSTSAPADHGMPSGT